MSIKRKEMGEGFYSLRYTRAGAHDGRSVVGKERSRVVPLLYLKYRGRFN